MNSDTRDGARAVVLAVIMVLSVVAMGVAFTGSAAAQQSETTLVVDATEGADDGSSPFETIQAAIDTAGDGDRIEVETGSYSDFELNTPNVTVVGVGDVTIESSQVDIEADGAEIRNVTFTGDYSNWRDDSANDLPPSHVDSPSNSDFYPIVWIDANDATVDNVDIVIDTNSDWSSAVTGIVVSGDSNVVNSQITVPVDDGYHGQPALEFTSGSSVTIENNNFSRNIGGFVGAKSQDVAVRNNNFTGETRNLGFTGPNWGPIPEEAEITVDGNNLPIKIERDQHANGWYYAGDSIQSAFEGNHIIAEGGTLDVPAGTYNENVTIDIPGVTIEGPNANVPGDSNSRSEEATLGGQIVVSSDNVTVRGLTVSPDEFTQKSAAGILVSGNDSHVTNNIIEGIRGDGSVSVHGIQIFEQESPNVEDVTISDNLIRDLDNDDKGGVGIKIQNQLSHIEVRNNTVTNIHSAGWSYGIVSTPSSEHTTQPENVLISGNSISAVGNGDEYDVFTSEGAPFPGVAVGLDTASGDYEANSPADANEVTIRRNNFDDVPTGVINKDTSSTLTATNNWWGSENGPSAGSANTYNDGDQGAEVSDNVEFTPWLNASTDNGGQSFAPVVNYDTGEQFASIQEALGEASNGEHIYAAGGSYDEYLRFNADNVTLYSDEDATVAPTEDTMADDSRGRIVDTNGANEIRITGISVEGIGTSASDPTGITLNGENTSVNNVTVENVLTGVQTSSGGSDGARIHGVTVRNVGVGVSIQSNDTVLANSTIESAEIEGVGLIDGRERIYVGNNDFADVSGPLIKLYDLTEGTDSTVAVSYNNLSAGDSAIVNKDTGHVEAIFNWFGSEDGPSDGDIEGDVTYDPFLTAPSDEVERPTQEDGVLTRQFASDLTLDEGVNAFAFPAPSERSLNETVNLSNVQAVYAYDNVEESWTQISDDPTPGALDVFVVVVEDGKTAEAVMEFENDRSEQTVPEATEVSGGWNLVSPTQAGANVDEAFATQNADIQTTLSDSPFQSAGSQPLGAGDKPFSPYNAYWTFIDDDEGDSTIAATTYDGITAEEFFVNVDLLTAPENEG